MPRAIIWRAGLVVLSADVSPLTNVEKSDVASRAVVELVVAVEGVVEVATLPHEYLGANVWVTTKPVPTMVGLAGRDCKVMVCGPTRMTAEASAAFARLMLKLLPVLAESGVAVPGAFQVTCMIAGSHT